MSVTKLESYNGFLNYSGVKGIYRIPLDEVSTNNVNLTLLGKEKENHNFNNIEDALRFIDNSEVNLKIPQVEYI
jgi:hypothetical protein